MQDYTFVPTSPGRFLVRATCKHACPLPEISAINDKSWIEHKRNAFQIISIKPYGPAMRTRTRLVLFSDRSLLCFRLVS